MRYFLDTSCCRLTPCIFCLLCYYGYGLRFRTQWRISANWVFEKGTFIMCNKNESASCQTSNEEFTSFIRKWIETLPKGEDTMIQRFDGRPPLRVGDLLENPKLLLKFRNAFFSSHLDDFVVKDWDFDRDISYFSLSAGLLYCKAYRKSMVRFYFNLTTSFIIASSMINDVKQAISSCYLLRPLPILVIWGI